MSRSPYDPETYRAIRKKNRRLGVVGGGKDFDKPIGIRTTVASPGKVCNLKYRTGDVRALWESS